MMMRKRLALVGGLAIVLYCATAAAQSIEPAGRILVAMRPAGTSRLAGTVVTPSGDAIPDARLTLRVSARVGRPAAEWTSRARTDGTFEFTRLPDGEYALYAEHDGYTPVEIRAADDVRLGTALALADGEDRQDVTAIVHPAATISGVVTRADGTPAEGATLTLGIHRPDGTVRRVPLQPFVRADVTGRYRFTEVPSGAFILDARGMPDGASPSDVLTRYPGVRSSQDGTPLMVAPNASLDGVDFALLDTPPAYAVVGRVVDRQGRAAGGSALSLVGAEAAVSLRVQDDGRFRTPPLPSGSTLVARAYSRTTDGWQVGTGSVRIGDDVTELPSIVLEPAGTVDGRVTASRELPPGLSVRLLTVVPGFPPTAHGSGLPDQEAAVAPDGRFHLDGALGRQLIQLAALPEGWRVTNVLLRGVPLADRTLTIASGESIDDVTIVVSAGPATKTVSPRGSP